MIRKALTTLSLIGLLISVGLWGVSYWNVGVAIDRSSTIVVIEALHGGLRIGVTGYPSRNVGHRTTWGMDGFKGFKTSIVGPWINNYGNGTSVIIPLPFFAFLFGTIFVYCALPFHCRRKRKKLGLCLQCGYDLRGSKERCPECGETKK